MKSAQVNENYVFSCVCVPTRTLLWHGSRLSNWVGILNQGLRVAPPEAPVTGYMVRRMDEWMDRKIT